MAIDANAFEMNFPVRGRGVLCLQKMDSNRIMHWLAPRAGSRTDLDIVSSNTSLLHSIYGSQVSQLPLSEAANSSQRNSVADNTCYYHSESIPSLLSRPKSAPPKSFARQRVTSARPRTITPIGSAPKRRPLTAAVPRTATSVPNQKGRARTRPSTAVMLYRRYSSTEQSTTDAGGTGTLTNDRMKEKAVPVALSSTPQYFNFWLEKPLLPKTWDINMHQRKSRHRPKSDYGVHINRNRNKKSDSNNKNGNDNETDGTKLGTLLEVDDNLFGNGRGRGNGLGNEDDELNSKRSGKGDRDGLLNDDDANMASNTSTTLTGDMADDNDRMKTLSGYDTTRSNIGDQDNNKFLKVPGHGQFDEDNDAESDDFFAKKKFQWLGDLNGSNGLMTRFELPMDLRILEKMTPIEYLSKYCVLSYRKKSHYLKVFEKLKYAKNDTISGKDLISKGLIDAHYGLISKDQTDTILKLVEISENEKVSLQLFGALCAVTERVFGATFIPAHLRKELIELVDFEALDWRLRYCTISESLQSLFDQF